jgi:hypothetical protein
MVGGETGAAVLLNAEIFANRGCFGKIECKRVSAICNRQRHGLVLEKLRCDKLLGPDYIVVELLQQWDSLLCADG